MRIFTNGSKIGEAAGAAAVLAPRVTTQPLVNLHRRGRCDIVGPGDGTAQLQQPLLVSI